jgi:hypothetical protein
VPPNWLRVSAESAIPPDQNGRAETRRRHGNRIGTVKPGEPPWYDPRFNQAERETLRSLAASKRFADRKLCLRWLRQGSSVRSNANLSVELAESLARDPRNAIYSFALSVLEDRIDACPEKVWPAIERLSRTRDRGYIGGLAAFLLEHLLSVHHDEYLAKVRVKLEAGDWRMAVMLDGCWRFGQTEEQYAEITGLVEEFRHLLKGG